MTSASSLGMTSCNLGDMALARALSSLHALLARNACVMGALPNRSVTLLVRSLTAHPQAALRGLDWRPKMQGLQEKLDHSHL